MCFNRYEVYDVPDGEYGELGEDGKWTGLVGMVERGVWTFQRETKQPINVTDSVISKNYRIWAQYRFV